MADKDATRTTSVPWSYALVSAAIGLFIGAIAGYQFLTRLMSIQPQLAAMIGGAIGAVAGAISGYTSGRAAAEHAEAVQQVAQKLGGQYLPGDAELTRRLSTDFNLGDAAMYNVVSKDLQGARVEIGELQITTTTSGTRDDRQSTTVSQTAAFFAVEGLRFPQFMLQPQGVMLKLFAHVIGGEKIEFPAQPYFSEIYHLSATHSEHARRLFDGGVLDALVRRPGLRIQTAGDALLIYEPGRQCEPEELEGFIAEATKIFRLFEASARRMSQEDETRVAPKEDVRALADKMPGLMGRIVRSNLVTHADVNAFIRQAAPRTIPPNILKYRERVAPRAFLFVGMFLVMFGALWVLSVQTNGAGQPMTTGLVIGAGGALIVVGAALARMRVVRLLRRGQLGTAVIERIGRSQFAGTLRIAARCQAEGRAWQATSTWYPPANTVADSQARAQRLADNNKPAPILYDPGAPKRMLFVDSLLNVSAEYEP